MLTNLTPDATLLGCLTDALSATTNQGAKRHLVAISCYFDVEAVETLVRHVHDGLRDRGAQLTRVSLFVDPGEWAKSRATAAGLRARIRSIVDPLRHLHVGPAWFDGRLFHAKGYALIGPRNAASGRRRGFLAVTSGNLTRRGLGLDETPNVEFVHWTQDPDVLDDLDALVTRLVEDHRPPEHYDRRNDDFLLGLRIFGSGDFYHKWNGSLSSEARFALNLTEAGRAERAKKNRSFAGYAADSTSISRDPIGLTEIIEKVQRPFPRRFWDTYSVDTLLERWVPAGIAAAIDEVLKSNAKPYVEAVGKAIRPRRLNPIREELLKEVRGFWKKGWIENDPDVVDRWTERVKGLPANEELIALRVLPYEKIPDILDSANRTIVLRLVAHARAPERMGRAARGLKRVLADALNNGAEEWDDELVRLQAKAKLELGLAE